MIKDIHVDTEATGLLWGEWRRNQHHALNHGGGETVVVLSYLSVGSAEILLDLL